MLKLLKFAKHLDNGYGKPVCNYSAPGKTVKWGDGLYNCSECQAKVKEATRKQEQIDALNSSAQDIYKQLYATKDKPRKLEPELELNLRKQLLKIERERRAVISTVNTVESDIMAQLVANKYLNQNRFGLRVSCDIDGLYLKPISTEEKIEGEK